MEWESALEHPPGVTQDAHVAAPLCDIAGRSCGMLRQKFENFGKQSLDNCETRVSLVFCTCKACVCADCESCHGFSHSKQGLLRNDLRDVLQPADSKEGLREEICGWYRFVSASLVC